MSEATPVRKRGETKRAFTIRCKRARKTARFKRDGQGESRYARKQRGEIEPIMGGPLVWCPGCYCRHCQCEAHRWAR